MPKGAHRGRSPIDGIDSGLPQANHTHKETSSTTPPGRACPGSVPSYSRPFVSQVTKIHILVYPRCTFRTIPWGRGEEKRMYVRAMLCNCRRRLEAEDDRNLRVLVREHLTAEHATVPPMTDGL